MVEVSLRSTAAPLKISPLTRVASVVQPQLDEVSARIARQTEAFDPAIEGYISYALESGGKRLRPLVALLAGAATGAVTTAHIDLAVIVELIHLATLVHDDIIDDAERRRSQPTLNARWGNALSVLLGDSLFAHALECGGKRLRPLVALLAGAATGAVTTAHIDLAVIVELIHLATLVHDDIIDDAERRRSQPTLNARWGNALTVLLGDSLFAHAL